MVRLAADRRYSLYWLLLVQKYLLYKHKSTYLWSASPPTADTRFTGFTSTKVRVLTAEQRGGGGADYTRALRCVQKGVDALRAQNCKLSRAVELEYESANADALAAVLKQVWMVSEGMLEFPLSDLWRMGDHYMVTLMQEHLLRHLWHAN